VVELKILSKKEGTANGVLMSYRFAMALLSPEQDVGFLKLCSIILQFADMRKSKKRDLIQEGITKLKEEINMSDDDFENLLALMSDENGREIRNDGIEKSLSYLDNHK